MSLSGGRRQWAGRAGIVLFWVAIGVYYAFLMSAGRWTHWPTWSALYDKQAEAYRAGHLYLLEPRSPELRALPDPLNPANMHFWRWDHSYYKGRLYLYWGFVPAALLAAVKALLRIHTAVGDQWPVFLCGLGRAIVGTLLIRALARTAEPAPPRWAVWAATLVFTLANPIPYFLSRGAVYEAAIAAGSLFMLCGLSFGLGAVTRAGSRAADAYLLASGFAFGLCAGSRISLLPAAGLLTAWTIVACWRAAGGGWRRLLRPTLLAGLPALALVMVQLTMNDLRFDRWLEFGVTYQMSFRATHGERFVIPNVLMYLFRPILRSCEFPYLITKWNTKSFGLPPWLPLPPGDHIEPSTGILSAVPYVWLLILAPVVWLVQRFACARPVVARWPARPVAAAGPLAPGTRRWVIGALTLAVVATAIPPLTVSNSMRYEWDFISAVFLAAALASWWLLRAPRSGAGRVAVAVLVATLAVASIVVGILLGFVGYFDNFMRHNPELMNHLKRMFDLCRKR